jgi:hypothetical protein
MRPPPRNSAVIASEETTPTFVQLAPAARSAQEDSGPSAGGVSMCRQQGSARRQVNKAKATLTRESNG